MYNIVKMDEIKYAHLFKYLEKQGYNNSGKLIWEMCRRFMNSRLQKFKDLQNTIYREI